jgi:uncharacterized membrane protein YdjX (TVP38/TMEM64 family)
MVMPDMRKERKNSTREPLTLGSFAFPALLVALVVAGLLLKDWLTPLLSQREAMRNWVRSFGAAGWLMFILLHVLQVVVFVVPGEVVQVSGGFIFGFWGGLALSTLGIALGSALNFFLGRLLGPRFLMAILRREQYEKLQKYAADARSFAGLILLFVIPGIPKDLLCYFAGAGAHPFWLFLVASMIARMPGIVGTTLAGSAVYRERFGLVIALAVLTAILMVLLLVFRNQVEAVIRKYLHRSNV